MKLAAPAIAGEFHLVYERFDSGKNAFWVTVFVSFTLRNILQDEAYTDQIEIMVSPDVVPDVVEIGRLLESALSCSNLNPQRIVHVVSKPISVRDKRYQEFVDVTIPAKSEAIHSYSFEVWSLQGVPFEFHAQRYSEGVAVRVSNRTAGQITCELSKGTNNPTVEREILERKVIPTFSMETLANDVVLDGNKDNMALIVTL